ncbi:diacylglycerol O-acyltransferase 2 [Alligator mississippiensis]|uniref:Acyltransferase n=1 Tax=Alligator mississippiensis TaxID=8496 RepID=A0A151NNI9_ALLMI|nr:diacylglycerol O-acyltransferase 2 [Alligator mississippiensis]KYO38391.1 acyl-CoA wax alcohol acyltransferase 2 [Alligator mississippiensis]
MKTLIAAYSQNRSGSHASIQAALHTLLTAPWPSQRDVRACLQLLSVLQWVLSFLFMGIISLLLLIYLVFTSFWPISALYLVWLIFDWDTPERGGRRFAWLRKWAVWRHFRDYFPIQLVKTHDLHPSQNYIIGSHPHGILCVGAFCNFITGSTGFFEKYPGIRSFLATLSGNFRMPFFREYLMSGGLCPVTRQAIGYLLSRNGTGNAVAIVIGGAAESLSCQPGVTTLILKNRKGFVRMALQHGAHLVPSFSFGENELFRQVVFKEGSWMRNLQERCRKLLGFAPCLFYGRGLTSIHSRGFLPFPRPITTVVGEPMTVPKIEDPSHETVDLYHGMYIRSLLKLFNEHKAKYGLSETDELRIL